MPTTAQILSVKRRLTRLILTSSLGVLGFTCVTLFIFEVRSFRSETARNLSTAASIIAENSSGVLLFDDQKTAADILGGLRAEPGIKVQPPCLIKKAGCMRPTPKVFPVTYDGDGAPALCGIKEAGGITLAQKSDTAGQPESRKRDCERLR